MSVGREGGREEGWIEGGYGEEGEREKGGMDGRLRDGGREDRGMDGWMDVYGRLEGWRER